MSIDVQHRNEFEDTDVGCAGTLTTSSNCGIELIPFNVQLKGVMARLGTAGGTQATIVDLQLSHAGGAFASIFSGATKINFATSSQTPTYGALTNNPPTFVKGDILKVVVTQVGSTPAPADLALALLFARTSQLAQENPSLPPATGLQAIGTGTLTDTFGAWNEF